MLLCTVYKHRLTSVLLCTLYKHRLTSVLLCTLYKHRLTSVLLCTLYKHRLTSVLLCTLYKHRLTSDFLCPDHKCQLNVEPGSLGTVPGAYIRSFLGKNAIITQCLFPFAQTICSYSPRGGSSFVLWDLLTLQQSINTVVQSLAYSVTH